MAKEAQVKRMESEKNNLVGNGLRWHRAGNRPAGEPVLGEGERQRATCDREDCVRLGTQKENFGLNGPVVPVLSGCLIETVADSGGGPGPH